MTDEELRERIRDIFITYGKPWAECVDETIALCREHYGSEVERLRRERDETRGEIKRLQRYSCEAAAEIREQTRRASMWEDLCHRALRKEKGDD